MFFGKLKNIFKACAIIESSVISPDIEGSLGKIGSKIDLFSLPLSLISQVTKLPLNALLPIGKFFHKIDQERMTNLCSKIGLEWTSGSKACEIAHKVAYQLTFQSRRQIRKLMSLKEEYEYIKENNSKLSLDFKIISKSKQLFASAGEYFLYKQPRTQTYLCAEYAVSKIIDAICSNRFNLQEEPVQQLLNFVYMAPKDQSLLKDFLNAIGMEEFINRDGQTWSMEGIYQKPEIIIIEDSSDASSAVITYKHRNSNGILYGQRYGSPNEVKKVDCVPIEKINGFFFEDGYFYSHNVSKNEAEKQPVNASINHPALS